MDFLDRHYTTTELIEVLDLTRTRLRPWVDLGYVFPSVLHSSNQGTKHLYSIEDVYCTAIFKYLLEFGFSRDRAGAMIKNWKFFGEWGDKNHILVFIDEEQIQGTILNFNHESEIDEKLQAIKKFIIEGKSVISINVSHVIEGVNQKIKELL